MVVVTAPDEMKIARWVARISPLGSGHATAEADARARLAHQIPDAEKAARADFVLDNTGDLAALRAATVTLWQQLQEENNRILPSGSLE